MIRRPTTHNPYMPNLSADPVVSPFSASVDVHSPDSSDLIITVFDCNMRIMKFEPEDCCVNIISGVEKDYRQIKIFCEKRGR